MVSRSKALIALILVVAVIASLIWLGVTKASSYYLTADEALAKGSSIYGYTLKVSGKIAPDSVYWNPNTMELRFRIQGTDPVNTIPVTYHGPEPSDFTNNWPVVVDGKIDKLGVFQASQVLVKCPSKYEASQKQSPANKSNNYVKQQAKKS